MTLPTVECRTGRCRGLEVLGPRVVLGLLGLGVLSRPGSMLDCNRWRLSCDVEGGLGRQARNRLGVLLIVLLVNELRGQA